MRKKEKDTVITELRDFGKNSMKLLEKCKKPDKKGKIFFHVQYSVIY
jgi:hypothetical protein